MFGTVKITVCDLSHTGISATIFDGLVVKKKIENTSFQALQLDFGIKRVRILLPEGVAEEPILKSAADAGLIVEAYEPPSASMARMATHIHEPFLLIYPQVTPEFICAIAGGKVLDVTRVEPLKSLEDTKQMFIKQVADAKGILVKAIATNVPDPVVGLAMKKEEKKPFLFPLPLVIGGIVFLIIAIGFFSVRLRRSSSTIATQVILTSTPTPAPIVRSELKVEVQNGSGIAGLASKGKKVLEELGYVAVTTANADTYDYIGVTVKGKTFAISAFILSDIKETYKNASISSALLDNSSPVDAIVILGK